MAYIYRHIRHDKNEVFYIWVSTKNNFYRAYDKYGRTQYRHNIANKWYDVEIMLDWLDNDIAFEKEIEFIKLYGRFENWWTLCNLTDWWEWAPWKVFTDIHRQRISEANKWKKLSEETKQKLREANLWKKASDGTKKKLSDMRRWKKKSEEWKRKISESNKWKKMSDEQKLFISNLHKWNKYSLWRKASDETKRKQSLAKIGKLSRNSNRVIDIETWTIYGSITRCANTLWYNRRTLNEILLKWDIWYWRIYYIIEC